MLKSNKKNEKNPKKHFLYARTKIKGSIKYTPQIAAIKVLSNLPKRWPKQKNTCAKKSYTENGPQKTKIRHNNKPGEQSG